MNPWLSEYLGTHGARDPTTLFCYCKLESERSRKLVRLNFPLRRQFSASCGSLWGRTTSLQWSHIRCPTAQILTSWFIKVAKSQLRNSSEDSFMAEGSPRHEDLYSRVAALGRPRTTAIRSHMRSESSSKPLANESWNASVPFRGGCCEDSTKFAKHIVLI